MLRQLRRACRALVYRAGHVRPGTPSNYLAIASVFHEHACDDLADAYADYSKGLFERIKPTQLSLLDSIESAKNDQPFTYPHRDILREGKRDVHHWHGEESLYTRKDGTHDFEWALVGTPRDVANPSEFNATMYTKVAHNTVGAAPHASLTDGEAVALFDRLLSGLKYRVKVPGAPPGSYYFPKDKSAAAQPN